MALKFLNDGYFAGKVGIGTESPTEPLTVSKTASGSTTQIASLVNPVGTANTGVRLWMSGTNTTTRGTFIDAVAETTSNDHSLRFGTSASSSTPTERMRIDSSGRLLINATSTVFSDHFFINSDAYSTGGWRVGSSSTYVGKIRNNAGKLEIVTDTNRDIQFGDAGTPNIMYIDTSAENVGIGTTSPGEKLDLAGTNVGVKINGTQSSRVYYNRSGTYTWSTGLRSGDTKFHIFDERTGDRVIIDDAGNVGIGTTSPDYQLEVENTSAQATVGITGGNTDARLHLKNNEGTWLIQNDYSNTGALSFYNSTHRVVITEGGNVGIGTTSPSANLYVSGSNADATDKPTMISESVFTVKPVALNSGNLNFAQVDSGNSIGMQYTNGSGTANWDISMQPFGGNVGIGTVSPTAGLHVVGTGLFTGLVSGITPVNAANFVTKAYVDGSGGGTGPFLPLAGGTMTGVAGVVFPDAFKLNLGTGSDLEIYHNGLSGNNNIDNINGDLYMSQYANDKDIIFRSDNVEELLNIW